MLGGMPIMPATVHPIALLNLLRTKTNAFICSSSRSIAIFIGKVLLDPKNIYFKWAGRAFNSNTSGSSVDGLVGDV